MNFIGISLKQKLWVALISEFQQLAAKFPQTQFSLWRESFHAWTEKKENI